MTVKRAGRKCWRKVTKGRWCLRIRAAGQWGSGAAGQPATAKSTKISFTTQFRWIEQKAERRTASFLVLSVVCSLYFVLCTLFPVHRSSIFSLSFDTIRRTHTVLVLVNSADSDWWVTVRPRLRQFRQHKYTAIDIHDRAYSHLGSLLEKGLVLNIRNRLRYDLVSSPTRPQPPIFLSIVLLLLYFVCSSSFFSARIWFLVFLRNIARSDRFSVDCNFPPFTSYDAFSRVLSFRMDF